MTYGWAILIIAIVLVALFSLGVFNSANFAPKAPPGSCQVFRPDGPGTTFDLNLEGECNGELPQYAAYFNGQSSGVSIIDANMLDFTGGILTVSTWIYWGGGGNANYLVDKYSNKYSLELSPNGPTQPIGRFLAAGSGYAQGAASLSPNVWYYFVGTYSQGNALFYVDGQQIGSSTGGSSISSGGNLEIGCYASCSSSYSFNGLIANVQIYNTSLGASSVQALYNEGIGGVPIDITNLVGWWPLNGNANDYSGNQNNGAATSVIYTTSWTNGYTTP